MWRKHIFALRDVPFSPHRGLRMMNSVASFPLLLCARKPSPAPVTPKRTYVHFPRREIKAYFRLHILEWAFPCTSSGAFCSSSRRLQKKGEDERVGRAGLSSLVPAALQPCRAGPLQVGWKRERQRRRPTLAVPHCTSKIHTIVCTYIWEEWVLLTVGTT